MSHYGCHVDEIELMTLALEQAQMAPEHGDVPIGALVVMDGRVIASAHNERELRGDPTAHAEVLAIRAAAAELGTSRLDGATLVSTLEPCPMCAGAALLARVGRVVFGAEDPKGGAVGSLYNLGSDPRLNHEFEVVSRVMKDECGTLLQNFFAERRDQPSDGSFR